MADELKAKGNAAFQAGDNEQAVNWFSQAIDLDPANHILYSNRSAAYCADEKYAKALADAIKVTEIKPDWAKGWSRKGAALHGKGDYDGAIEAYAKGLEIEPSNDACKKGKEDAAAAKLSAANSGLNPFAKIFGPDVWVKIGMNPKLKPYLDQPDYVNMIKMMQANPQNMNMFLQDKRIMQTFAALSGLNFDMAGGDDAEDAPPPPPPKPAPKKEAPKKEFLPGQEEADKKKDEGNQFYKAKEFDKALECYEAALEACPKNSIYRINKAAVYMEMKEYDKCIACCDEVIEKALDYRTDGQVQAKALARKGGALQKKGDLEGAIQALKSSLVEHRTADTLTKLRAAEKAKKEADIAAYLDDDKAAEAKERGNEFFKANKYPEAIQEYTEAIKRNPKDHTFYSNRAAGYMKMGEYNHALKDCDAALELSPEFVKAMTRKADCYYWTKEYHKALEWYQKCLKIEPDNQQLREGVDRTLRQINVSQGDEVDEDRVRRAMADPEIQAMLSDPILQMALRDFQENPAAAQQHLQNPEMRSKIEKLIAAGVIRTSSR
uniref:STI1 domain-containing protein n=1 Tax=Eutreptiella gymnastica TaxID=73025 RepID=A0A7S1NNF9_9EUGL|mmetsp:Transcript_56704/g.101101  ORF Transcript_56704/g.101101 Transcript_56704/m.101101 type:complete len:550 (+) Transcript_56704:75-1724(+)